MLRRAQTHCVARPEPTSTASARIATTRKERDVSNFAMRLSHENGGESAPDSRREEDLNIINPIAANRAQKKAAAIGCRWSPLGWSVSTVRAKIRKANAAEAMPRIDPPRKNHRPTAL